MKTHLENLKDNLRNQINPAPVAGHCIKCKQPFTDANVFTAAGWRETKISGVCEKCFDTMWPDDELAEDDMEDE